MRWTPTHRITCTPKSEASRTFEVMAFDLGYDHPGPGRYALFTRDEWDAGTPPDWTMDSDGKTWFQGEAAPGEGSAMVTGIWDE